MKRSPAESVIEAEEAVDDSQLVKGKKQHKRNSKKKATATTTAADKAAATDTVTATGTTVTADPTSTTTPTVDSNSKQLVTEKVYAKQQKRYGPAFGGPQTTKNDEWQTTKRSWEDVAKLMESWKDKTIWQPFYYDGMCSQYLKELGFKKVIHTKTDFFKQVTQPKFLSTVDLIFDNPPYTSHETKQKILQCLVDSKKPFIILLPMNTIHNHLFRQTLNTDKVQLIVPRKVYTRKTGDPQELPFKYLAWVCYDMNFEKDLYFV